MAGADFIYFDLRQQKRGAVVEIEVDTAANVFLMDSSNFMAYKNARRYRYYGGEARRSPVRLAVPRTAHWYLVLDLGGYPGSIRHSNPRILPGPMPPLRNADPRLAEIADNAADLFAEEDVGPRQHDVFVSHASEDKDAIVRPLAHALDQSGMDVWYDEFEMRIGDAGYAPALDKHVLPRLGRLKLREVTPEGLARFRADLEKAGVGRSSVRISLVVVQAMFSRAEEWGWVSSNPAKAVRKPSGIRERAVVCLEPARVEAIRDVMSAQRRPYAALMVSLAA